MRGVSWFCLCFGIRAVFQTSIVTSFLKMIQNLKKNGNQNTLMHTIYFLFFWISYLQSDNPYSYAFIRSKVTLANRNKIPKKRDRGCVRRNDSADEFWLKDWIIWSLVSSFKSLQFKRVQITDKMEGYPNCRALVSTGAIGAVAPELFEEHIGQKQIFCDISKVLLVKN